MINEDLLHRLLSLISQKLIKIEDIKIKEYKNEAEKRLISQYNPNTKEDVKDTTEKVVTQ